MIFMSILQIILENFIDFHLSKNTLGDFLILKHVASQFKYACYEA